MSKEQINAALTQVVVSALVGVATRPIFGLITYLSINLICILIDYAKEN